MTELIISFVFIVTIIVNDGDNDGVYNSVSEWVSSFLTALRHILGYIVL